MTKTKHILTASVAFFVLIASQSRAQNLGERYAEVNASLFDFNTSGIDSAYGGGFGVNVPVAKSVDLSFNYGFTSLEQYDVIYKEHDATISAVFYKPYGKLSPFLSLDIGGAWTHWDTPFGNDHLNSLVYGGTIGFEYRVTTRFTTAVGASYHYLDKAEIGTWNYGVKASYEIGNNYFLSAGFSISEDSDRFYTAGLGYRF